MIKSGRPRSHFATQSARNASRASKRCRGVLFRIPIHTPYAATRTTISRPGTSPPMYR